MQLSYQEYIKSCIEKAASYVKNVKNGTITTNSWIKLAVEKHLIDSKNPLLHYKVDQVHKVFWFFSVICVNKDNEYQQVDLLPWQCFIIVSLFGFYWHKTGRRKYRTFLLFVARKNGKTTFADILQLVGLMVDNVQDAQSLLVANSREQAQIALTLLTGIVLNSPALDKRLYPQRNRIIFKDFKNISYCKTLAANYHRLDGYSANFALLDECAEMESADLYNVIKKSTLVRENPLVCLISTASFSLDNFFYDFIETAKNILKGTVEDESLFPMIYTLDDKDDPADSTLWIKSNPSLGVLFQKEDLMIEFKGSRNSEAEMNAFLVKNLNVFTSSEAAWISNENLMKVVGKIDEDKLEGLPCWAGIDLSSTQDLTSLVLILKKDGKFFLIPYFFSANNPKKNMRKGGHSIKKWVEQGHISQSQKKTIDYDMLYEEILKINGKYPIQRLNYDKWNSALLIPRLEEDGIYCESFAQNCMTFNEPLKYLEKLIFEGDITIKDNPVMPWNFRNVVLYQDGNENIKVMKNKSLDAVDGVVAAGMAVGAYIESNKFDYDKE